ncbi:MAG: orotidine-5'-phosphate decarboxylase [Beijerinckiaceae bacterium]|jgi:orotidine-5'-phosphate decarboxylase|nr:orotidine-5'-phosphate decarboxylase [Beijerinckiaceae bacterium]
MTEATTARDRLIVALDLADAKAAEDMVARLGDSVSFYKIGLELTYGGGLGLAERLIRQGKQVFLDLKFHDIPNTVARATAQVADLGATFLTVHAYPQTMRAAVGALGGSKLKILAVTVMTSYDDADLAEAGFGLGVADLVARRAAQAKAAGVHGLILSAEEAPAMRAALGPAMLLVTPGIRPAGAAIADQKRVMTPSRAILAGADHLVVGRPVTQAADPRAAAEAIVAEIAAARP